MRLQAYLYILMATKVLEDLPSQLIASSASFVKRILLCLIQVQEGCSIEDFSALDRLLPERCCPYIFQVIFVIS